jgi:hypothetical protein
LRFRNWSFKPRCATEHQSPANVSLNQERSAVQPANPSAGEQAAQEAGENLHRVQHSDLKGCGVQE